MTHLEDIARFPYRYDHKTSAYMHNVTVFCDSIRLYEDKIYFVGTHISISIVNNRNGKGNNFGKRW